MFGLLASQTFVKSRAFAVQCIKLPKQKQELLPIIGISLVAKFRQLVATRIDSNILIAVDAFQKLVPAVAIEEVAIVLVDYS